MGCVRLIHCADLHLGARMTANLDAKRAKERREELLAMLDRIVRVALEREAKAILLVGDLFDTERVTVSTRRYVGQLISEHSELYFIYVSGNHDREVLPLFDEDRLPTNWIDLSGRGWSSVDLTEDGVALTVSGTSNLQYGDIYDTVPHADGYHIVMLHGEITAAAVAAQDTVSLSRLVGRGIDYLALGHEHSYRTDRLDAGGVWCYSGCPEGRGFDECGKKGVVLLEIRTPESGGKPRMTAEFLPIAKRTLHRLPVDVSACTDTRDALRCVREAAAMIDPQDMLLAELVGQISPETSLDGGMLQTLLQELYFCARVEDHTSLLLRAEDYRYDISLKGEFVRTVMAANLPQSTRDRIILCGLRALRGEEAEL